MPAGERSPKQHFRSARNAVITSLLRSGELSRSELSGITGVSPAAITEVTQSLLQQGLLAEIPSLSTNGRRGRPIVNLRLQASHAYFVGISVGESAMPMVITNLCGEVIAHHNLPTRKSPGHLVKTVQKALQEILRAARIPRSRIRGIGITISGIVDANEGICRYSADLGWRDVPAAQLIAKALRIPVWVDNDANTIAVGEKFFGKGRDIEHFSSIMLGRTIGSAHYMHGKLYRGHSDSAGEIGHIAVVPGGLQCRCGRKGCLDTVAGGLALRNAAKLSGFPVRKTRELEEVALHGNTEATRLLQNAGTCVGLAVAALVHLNNPQCILFRDFEGFGDGIFRTATRQAIENNIMSRYLGSTQIIFNDAERDLLPRSAASIAAFEYLNSL